MNKAIVMGRLGQDVELKYTNGGQPVGNFSVATTEKWKDKDGNPQEKTEWHKITVWGKQAEIIEKYFRKGSQILLEGRIQTRQWEDKDGGKRYTTEIVLDKFEFVDKKDSNASPGGAGPGTSFDDEEIPF